MGRAFLVSVLCFNRPLFGCQDASNGSCPATSPPLATGSHRSAVLPSLTETIKFLQRGIRDKPQRRVQVCGMSVFAGRSSMISCRMTSFGQKWHDAGITYSENVFFPFQRHGLTDVMLAAAGPGHWISLHCGGYAAAAGQSSRVMLFNDHWHQSAG